MTDVIHIDKSYIGTFATGEDWTCFDNLDWYLEDVHKLQQGHVTEEDYVIWARDPNSPWWRDCTIELRGSNLSRFLTPNRVGELFYLLPAGTRLVMEVSEPLHVEDGGLFMWGQPGSGNDFSKSLKAIITIID
jgi:hypothetical protein